MPTKKYTAKDLTFVVCAYKECKYLEDCISSLESQSTPASIIISTSTPNAYIKKIAKKHHISIKVSPGGGQIADYNFAMAQASTPLVMLMHQDELLASTFVERVIAALNRAKKPIIAFTDYLEIHDDVIDQKPSGLVKTKHLMLLPARLRKLSGTWFGKRLIQLVGNPITHPTVVCVRKEMPREIFHPGYHAAMDWDLWERLSRQKGSFVYVPEVLLYHRMNSDNQTVKLLQTTNYRYNEELEIFSRFWPRPIAKLIMRFYSKAAQKYY